MIKTTEGIIKSLQGIKVLRIRLANQVDHRIYDETSYYLQELEDAYKHEIKERVKGDMREYNKMLEPVNNYDALSEYNKQELKRDIRIAHIKEFTLE